MLKLMAASESGSTSERSSSESTQREDGENRDPTRPAGESPGSVQVEQSVAAVPGIEATESRYRNGLIRILSLVTPDSFAVNHAVEDLRSMIEETVRREVGVLRKEMDAGFKAVEARFKAVEARFKAIESQLTMVRWMLGAVFTMLAAVLAALVALIVIVVNLASSVDRSGTPLPPPPSATVQAPAKTETVPPTGAGPGRESSAVAAPGGTAVTADPPADQTAP